MDFDQPVRVISMFFGDGLAIDRRSRELFTAAHSQGAAELRSPHRAAGASPSTSSAMINRGLPILAVCSSKGSRSFIELIFFS